MAGRTSYDEKNIEVLKGLEAVRRRPTMYVGDLSDPELPVRLLMQALCHAADCAVDGGCTRVSIRVGGAHVGIDYDAGMPLDPNAPHGDQVARLFLTALAACHNRKRHLSVGDELCGIGLAVLNALCASLKVRTVHGGWAATYRFEKGEQIGEAPIVESTEQDRTSISFHLDHGILGANVMFDPIALDRAIERVRQLLPSLRVEIDWQPAASSSIPGCGPRPNPGCQTLTRLRAMRVGFANGAHVGRRAKRSPIMPL